MDSIYKPKITIVTPSYNQGAYLEDTITSVLDQGYPNLEYIVIDGGSTDNSVEIIRKYAHRLSCWLSEKDNGLYHSLQKGFERSTGEIMGWINSDDMHHKRSLFTIAELFGAFPQINWLMGKNSFYDETGKMFVFDHDKFNERWSKWRMYDLDGKFIQQESVFWRRSLWDKSGGYIDSSLSLAGDADLWLRFFRHDELYSTTFLLSGFRIRNGNQKSSEQLHEYMEELKGLIRREVKLGNAGYYLLYIRLIKLIANFIPVRKLRNSLICKTMKITPKLMYRPPDGYFFRKKL